MHCVQLVFETQTWQFGSKTAQAMQLVKAVALAAKKNPELQTEQLVLEAQMRQLANIWAQQLATVCTQVRHRCGVCM
jgi:hypothetical protein